MRELAEGKEPFIKCKHGLQCTCCTCPGPCKDQPDICEKCEGNWDDVMLFCSGGAAKGAKRGRSVNPETGKEC